MMADIENILGTLTEDLKKFQEITEQVVDLKEQATDLTEKAASAVQFGMFSPLPSNIVGPEKAEAILHQFKDSYTRSVDQVMSDYKTFITKVEERYDDGREISPELKDQLSVAKFKIGKSIEGINSLKPVIASIEGGEFVYNSVRKKLTKAGNLNLRTTEVMKEYNEIKTKLIEAGVIDESGR